MPIERNHDCNHMVCGSPRCGNSFCYICGQEAPAWSNHWREGGCPKTGNLDDPAANFNPPEDENDILAAEAYQAWIDGTDEPERVIRYLSDFRDRCEAHRHHDAEAGRAAQIADLLI